MTEEQKSEFEQEDDKDRYNKRLLAQKQRTPTELKIKHSHSSGLKLTGFVFFAQKIRQLKLKDQQAQGNKKRQKVGNLMIEIKQLWAALSDAERKDYERKADFVDTQMKARKFKTQTFDDKMYGV